MHWSQDAIRRHTSFYISHHHITKTLQLHPQPHLTDLIGSAHRELVNACSVTLRWQTPIPGHTPATDIDL